MTYKQAFAANMRPYMLPSDSIEFLLSERGLDMEDEYEGGDTTKKLMDAVVDGLCQILSLKEEKDTGSSQIYDVNAVKMRIKILCRKYDIDNPLDKANEFTDRTSEW